MEHAEPERFTDQRPAGAEPTKPNHLWSGCLLPMILIALVVLPIATYVYGRRAISEVPYEAHYKDLVEIIKVVEAVAGPPYEQSRAKQSESSCDKRLSASWQTGPEAARAGAVAAAKWALAHGFAGPTTEYLESGPTESYSADRNSRRGMRTEHIGIWIYPERSGEVIMEIYLASTCYFPIGLPFYP